jgi:hypothetical protein
MAFKLPYRFLINPFLVVTRLSYKKALSLGTDHLAKLVANQADAVVAAIMASFTPVMDAFLAAQQNLDAALGDYQGETQGVEELFDLMNSEKLSYWEGQLFYHYPKGSVQATQLLPSGRKPFQGGTYEQRILAIKTFGDKCALNPSLGPLSVNVLAFHTQIASARALQQSAGEGQVDALRDLRETARVALCNEMYGNMGLLMHHHRTNPTEVDRYFDFSLMRTKKKNRQSTELKFTLASALTGEVITNGTAVLTLASGEVLTRQTNADGEVRFLIERLAEPTEASITFSAPDYIDRTESGPIEPGEDMDEEIELTPIAPPAPPTP